MIVDITLIMFGGVLFGYLARGRSSVKGIANTSATGSVYFLLCSLGFGLGANREVLTKFSTIGLSALVIAAAAIVGSIVAVRALARVSPGAK